MNSCRILVLVILSALVLSAEPLVPYRAWQFHTLDRPYVSETLKMARDYDVNTVVFSHGMIGYASQLFDGTDRGVKLRQLAKEAHAQNLRVWIWVRELQAVPERFIEGSVVQLDRPGLWEWLEQRYEQLFREYPEFDGLILTFHETQYKIFSPKQVSSELAMPDRFAKMINTIERACARHKKDFIVRSFLYEPQELAWFKEGYAKTDSRVMIQTKCEPHDWHPYYPNHPLIGAFPGRRQIIEFDGSSEYTGRNRIPYTQPEYFERRWRYDLAKGAAGYNVRLDHAGYDALRTPNEINIYAMYQFTEDPSLTGDQVWKEWTRKRYGDAAAPYVERALRPAFDIVNRSFFAMKFWVTNHSKLPDFAYADGHIRSRTLAKWYPEEPAYKALEQRLDKPDTKLLEEVLAEKDEAIAMADRSLQSLVEAKPSLSPKQFDDLYWRLALLRRTAYVWRLHAEALFGLKAMQAGHNVAGLEQRIERALAALEHQADVSAADPRIRDLPPASAKEIRAAVKDFRARLRRLQATR